MFRLCGKLSADRYGMRTGSTSGKLRSDMGRNLDPWLKRIIFRMIGKDHFYNPGF